MRSGEPGKGISEVDRSIELLEGLVAEQTLNDRFLMLLGRSFDLRGAAKGQLGDTKPALDDHQRAIQRFREAMYAWANGPDKGVNSALFPRVRNLESIREHAASAPVP